MKNIIEFLKKNGIEYQEVTYGNPYYYNDEFSVPAIRVTFDYELADDYKELKRKEHIFLQYIGRMVSVGFDSLHAHFNRPLK